MLREVRSKFIGVLAFVVAASVQSTFAQDAAGETVTDEELTQYATAMTKIDSLGEVVKTTFNDMVKSHELMDGGRNYVKLEGTKGDASKIAELELGPEVLAAYSDLKEAYDSLQGNYKEEYTRIVKDELGVSLYNEVRKGLADPAIKERYSAIVKELETDGEE